MLGVLYIHIQQIKLLHDFTPPVHNYVSQFWCLQTTTSSWSTIISPLQGKYLSHHPPLLSVWFQGITSCSGKCSITSLPCSLTFTIPGLPLCCFGCLSVVNSTHMTSGIKEIWPVWYLITWLLASVKRSKPYSHGGPPLWPSSQFFTCNLPGIESDCALLRYVHPHTGGLSGRLPREMLSLFLNFSTEQSIKFSISFGRLLKIIGALILKLTASWVLSLSDPWLGSVLLLHCHPVWSLWCGSIVADNGLGTKPKIFHV